MSNIHRTLAAGTQEKTFYPDIGDTGLTVEDTWHEVILPEGVKCKAVLIQVQNATVTDFNTDTDCVGFLYSSQDGGPGFLYQAIGRGIARAAEGPDSLGFIKAVAGKRIVVSVIS